MREHKLSLALAREVGAFDHEAAALGGIGDAEYVSGRMISANNRLNECVGLCRAHGFGRTEVANAAQIAHTLLYTRPLREAVTYAFAASTAAARVGHLRAELNASLVPLVALPLLGEWDACSVELERVRALVRRLGGVRFEQNCLIALGQIARAKGRNAEAVETLLRAADTAQRTGAGYLGPLIQSTLATALSGVDERCAALAEGEVLIARGCVGHNQLLFYPGAIDIAVEISNWDEVERYATALEAFTSTESMPWSEFFIDRGRALAAVGRGKNDACIIATLRRLLEQGERFGYATALPVLRKALADSLQRGRNE